jgi:hypothetical protein
MENSIIVDHVLEKLGFVNRQFYRLLLIVGPSERGQENIVNHVSKKINAPVANINLDVSRQLLELPEKQRPLNVAKILDSIIKSKTKNTFIFKNIELLFHAALETDPMRLFKNISRNKTLIVAWNGFIEDNYLIYAAPGHPDYKKYLTNDLNIINLHDSY